MWATVLRYWFESGNGTQSASRGLVEKERSTRGRQPGKTGLLREFVLLIKQGTVRPPNFCSKGSWNR